MKAIQIEQFGGPEVMQVVDLPTPQPGPGQIRIKIEAASVNYADVMRRSNTTYPFPTPLPFIPGSEVAGTVDALGDGVDGPAVGTPVFALVGNGSDGYAQYAVTAAAQVIPIPESVSMEVAAALPVAGTTALLLLRETAALCPGETVLVQGAAGGVGGYAIQLAKLLGAGSVIGATSAPNKFDKVRAAGADHVVDYTQADWPERVRDLTEGHGVDVLLEMNGGPTFAPALRCLAPFGRVVVYGMASGTPLSFDDASIERFFYKPSLNQSIHVFNLGLWFGMRGQGAGQAMADLIAYVASGQVQVAVDTVLPLTQAADAHRLIEARQATGKLILKPWADA